MKKILSLLVLFSILSLTACSSSSGQVTKLNYRLNSLLISDQELSFSFYLEKDELSQPENDGSLSVEDLPTELQAKSIFVSDISDKEKSSGISCDVSQFPYYCYLSLDENSSPSSNYLLKIEFEDGKYGEIIFEVPVDHSLEKPSIVAPLLEGEEAECISNENPTEEDPAVDDAFEGEGECERMKVEKNILKFKEIGADEYKINVALCYPYAEDGINPCLDAAEFEVKKEEGKFIISEAKEFYFAEMFLRGDFLEINFDFDPNYYDSVIYEVKAYKKEDISKDLNINLESTDEKTISLELTKDE